MLVNDLVLGIDPMSAEKAGAEVARAIFAKSGGQRELWINEEQLRFILVTTLKGMTLTQVSGGEA